VPVRFAAVGDAFVDRYRPPVGLSLVGGNALNVAVHLARLGREVAFFGAVGDDAQGERIRRTLAGFGIDTHHLLTTTGRTASTDVGVDAAGERSFLHEDYGVAARYRPDAAALSDLRRMAVVHLGWLTDPPALRAELAGSGVLVSQDTAVSPCDGGLGVAFGSAGPSRDAALTLAHRLAARNALAVVTCEAQGAVASDGRWTVEIGADRIEPVDTTGAGDSFIAGFLSALAEHQACLAGEPLGRERLMACLAAGRAVATPTCLHFGAFPQHPQAL